MHRDTDIQKQTVVTHTHTHTHARLEAPVALPRAGSAWGYPLEAWVGVLTLTGWLDSLGLRLASF